MPVTQNLAGRIETALGRRPRRLARMSGGCVAEIYRVELEGGDLVVAKLGRVPGALPTEAWMLRYLRAHAALPVPEVLHADDDLLLMSFIAGGDGLDDAAERHAAELLAALHGVAAPRFGLERDTLIGGLPQPNPPTDSWLAFFAEQRLVYMARQAHDAGRLPAATLHRVETLAGRLARWLAEPARPSLIHGDMWSGNVLARGGRIVGFVDPALYFADPEIELAFSTLFSTFGRTFFDHYGALRPLRPGFFEERRDLYNLYPLLVHARLFGGGYAAAVGRTLDRFGA
jgi:fructosamine-3-kinase